MGGNSPPSVFRQVRVLQGIGHQRSQSHGDYGPQRHLGLGLETLFFAHVSILLIGLDQGRLDSRLLSGIVELTWTGNPGRNPILA